jgi:hypothetical protein
MSGQRTIVKINWQKMREVIEHSIMLGAEETMHQWVKEISGGGGLLTKRGTYTSYRGGRKGKGSMRRRSKPGDPPARDSGDLARSVNMDNKRITKKGSVIRMVITGILPYGFYLDGGTKNKDGSMRIAPRPWIDRSKERLRVKTEPAYGKFIIARLNATLGKISKKMASLMKKR